MCPFFGVRSAENVAETGATLSLSNLWFIPLSGPPGVRRDAGERRGPDDAAAARPPAGQPQRPPRRHRPPRPAPRRRQGPTPRPDRDGPGREFAFSF